MELARQGWIRNRFVLTSCTRCAIVGSFGRGLNQQAWLGLLGRNRITLSQVWCVTCAPEFTVGTRHACQSHCRSLWILRTMKFVSAFSWWVCTNNNLSGNTHATASYCWAAIHLVGLLQQRFGLSRGPCLISFFFY